MQTTMVAIFLGTWMLLIQDRGWGGVLYSSSAAESKQVLHDAAPKRADIAFRIHVIAMLAATGKTVSIAKTLGGGRNMTMTSVPSANVTQAVPFFGVTNMEASLRFYVDGLGFQMTRWWIPEGPEEYEPNGRIRWCRLELGDAALMLQEFMPSRRPKDALGIGASVSFACEDALALYREFKSRGIAPRNRPFVGNGLWVVPLTDPDGYRIDFSSPTDAPEETELAE
jgi:uncharacterized glyoxalase superfamily protein PhnB